MAPAPPRRPIARELGGGAAAHALDPERLELGARARSCRCISPELGCEIRSGRGRVPNRGVVRLQGNARAMLPDVNDVSLAGGVRACVRERAHQALAPEATTIIERRSFTPAS